MLIIIIFIITTMSMIIIQTIMATTMMKNVNDNHGHNEVKDINNDDDNSNDNNNDNDVIAKNHYNMETRFLNFTTIVIIMMSIFLFVPQHGMSTCVCFTYIYVFEKVFMSGINTTTLHY